MPSNLCGVTPPEQLRVINNLNGISVIMPMMIQQQQIPVHPVTTRHHQARIEIPRTRASCSASLSMEQMRNGLNRRR